MILETPGRSGPRDSPGHASTASPLLRPSGWGSSQPAALAQSHHFCRWLVGSHINMPLSKVSDYLEHLQEVKCRLISLNTCGTMPMLTLEELFQHSRN